MPNESQPEISKQQGGSSDSDVVSSARDMLLAQAEQALRKDAVSGQSMPYSSQMLLRQDGDNSLYSYVSGNPAEAGYVKVNSQGTDSLGTEKSWVALTDPQGKTLHNIENDVYSEPITDPAYKAPPVVDVKIFHDQNGTVYRTDSPGANDYQITSSFDFRATPDSKLVHIGSATVEQTPNGLVEQLKDSSGKLIGTLTETTSKVKVSGLNDMVKIVIDGQH